MAAVQTRSLAAIDSRTGIARARVGDRIAWAITPLAAVPAILRGVR